MSYVVYHVETTYLLKGNKGKETFATLTAAKSALTRATKTDPTVVPTDYAISETIFFHEKIEKWVTKKNLMSGKPFKQPVNTPRCCDPSSELYWSM